MIIEFGWFLDREPWAHTNQGLNRVRVGRKNFIGILQTRLGLTRPDTPNAERVSQYAEKLKRIDSPDAWFHRSFQVDPWSTAQELLAAATTPLPTAGNGGFRNQNWGRTTASLASAANARCCRVAEGELASSLADDLGEILEELKHSRMPRNDPESHIRTEYLRQIRTYRQSAKSATGKRGLNAYLCTFPLWAGVLLKKLWGRTDDDVLRALFGV
ncbi:hypothetical protein SPF06_04795 [Sinomonas sp. JGH33]|uniref:DUF4158 domain-containing protein n=1 Tax=Sinomonas terricola TaxID=3110330 RepID=A0ABU5T301_9MICC|nr:hypothetical protein [Sinomonas sp. JGH33]MEA5454036.1 hypothetical protein [Sinomonas sp. JGH33]